MVDWQDRGACVGANPALFFPERGEVPREALLYCARCEVRTECGEAGKHEHFGVWGGVTRREAKRKRTQRRLVSQGRAPEMAYWLGSTEVPVPIPLQGLANPSNLM